MQILQALPDSVTLELPELEQHLSLLVEEKVCWLFIDCDNCKCGLRSICSHSYHKFLHKEGDASGGTFRVSILQLQVLFPFSYNVWVGRASQTFCIYCYLHVPCQHHCRGTSILVLTSFNIGRLQENIRGHGPSLH